MKKKQNMFYGLNIKYELETYRQVGYNYSKKKRTNKNVNKYALCDTYSEWKDHVEKILPNGIKNYDDFLHWLYRKRDYAEHYVETIKSVLLPIYIALITIPEFFCGIDVITKSTIMLVVLLLVGIVSPIFLNNAMEQVNFFRDFIQIAENNKKTTTKSS